MMTAAILRWKEPILGAIVLLIGVVGAERYLRHGFEARWLGDNEAPIATSVEHRTQFAAGYRPLAEYLAHAPYVEGEVPALPRLHATLLTDVQVPPGPSREVRAHTTHALSTATLWQEGARVREPLAPGRHRVEVRWSHRRPLDSAQWALSDLKLEWRAVGNEAWSDVPRDALFVPSSPVPRWIWEGLFVLCVALILGFRRRIAERIPRRLMPSRWQVALVGLLIAASAVRCIDYDAMPEHAENIDEVFAMWNGWSLIHEGQTRGWTIWPQSYPEAEHSQVRYLGRDYQVVSPYFEHPPLLHALVGVATSLGGAQHWTQTRFVHARLVPIALSILTLWLMFAVGRRMGFDAPSSFAGTAIYAFLPSIVLFNRVVKEEALVVPLMLGSVLAYLHWRESRRRRSLIVGAILAGLAVLAKVPAVVLVPMYVLLILHEGDYKAAGLAALVGILAASTILLFAWLTDWTTFWQSVSTQAGARPGVMDEFSPFFVDSRINHNRVGRPWLVYLWIAFCVTVLKTRTPVGSGSEAAAPSRSVVVAALGIPLVAYLFTIGISSASFYMGWYALPLYPLLCLGAGPFLMDMVRHPNLLRGALFLFLPLMYSIIFVMPPARFLTPWLIPNSNAPVAWVATLGMIPFGLAHLHAHGDGVWPRRLRRFAQGWALFLLLTFVVLSVIFVFEYDALYRLFHRIDPATSR